MRRQASLDECEQGPPGRFCVGCLCACLLRHHRALFGFAGFSSLGPVLAFPVWTLSSRAGGDVPQSRAECPKNTEDEETKNPEARAGVIAEPSLLLMSLGRMGSWFLGS